MKRAPESCVLVQSNAPVVTLIIECGGQSSEVVLTRQQARQVAAALERHAQLAWRGDRRSESEIAAG
jgi:hypothetical protein